MWYSCFVGSEDLNLMELTLDNLLLMWYDCLIVDMVKFGKHNRLENLSLIWETL